MPSRGEVQTWWWLHRQPAVLIDIVSTRGSVPREAGTRMLVSADGALGSIGGGHLEWKAMAWAREMLQVRPGPAAPRTEHCPLGPALGQCCGGVVTLRLRAMEAHHLAEWTDATPLFHLRLFGAGHVGRAIAQVLAGLNVSVMWVDEREGEFPDVLGGRSVWPDRIVVLASDAPEAEVASAPPGAYFLVLTHQHPLDLRLSEAILRRGDFGFFGLIGSRTKKQRFAHRLSERGIAPEVLSRMVCPIGLPGIHGKEPEVIAVAVVAQLLQVASVRKAVQPVAEDVLSAVE